MTDSTVSGQPFEPDEAQGTRRTDDELRDDELRADQTGADHTGAEKTGADQPRKDDGETRDPTKTPDDKAAPLSESTDGGLDGGDPGVEE